MKAYKFTAAALAALVVITAPAFARAPLGTVAQVREPLITAAIAYEISRKCEGIDLRLLRGISYLNGIKSTAAGLGYSSEEIDSFINDRAEKNALEDVARARMAASGVVVGQPQTYCALGRSEISAGSQIGRLLR